MDSRSPIRLRPHPDRRGGVHLGVRTEVPDRRQGTRRGGAGVPPVRRIRAVGTDAHRPGRVQGREREQVHPVRYQLDLRLLGGRLVRADERQDGRRSRKDQDRGEVPDRGVEGGRDGPDERGVQVGERGDHHQRRQVLADDAGRGAAVQRDEDQEVLSDHGPLGGVVDGGAGAVPPHAVHRRVLPPRRHLSAGRGSTEGEHAGQGVLRRGAHQKQAHHPESSHAVRTQGRSGEDVQKRPGQRHIHGGYQGGRGTQDHGGLLSQHGGGGGGGGGRCDGCSCGRRCRRRREGVDAIEGGQTQKSVPGLHIQHHPQSRRCHLHCGRHHLHRLRRDQIGLPLRGHLGGRIEEGTHRRIEQASGTGPHALRRGRERPDAFGAGEAVQEGILRAAGRQGGPEAQPGKGGDRPARVSRRLRAAAVGQAHAAGGGRHAHASQTGRRRRWRRRRQGAVPF
mmetsp:Transcript_37474/g.76414  ORF Transcript_37474/g.76414 Transcript_37474/m.76414 type:complete len:451 (-) Transcript_37474:350-1702(-)